MKLEPIDQLEPRQFSSQRNFLISFLSKAVEYNVFSHNHFHLQAKTKAQKLQYCIVINDQLSNAISVYHNVTITTGKKILSHTNMIKVVDHGL